jgi:hypothetical protein
MKSIARFLMPALALALVSIVGSTVTALAQPFPPVGTILTCPFRGTIVVNQNNVDFAGTVEGSGIFRVTATTATSATYTPVAITATSTFAALGTFTTRLDNNAAVAISVARSINGNGFPVIIPMRYPAIVTGPDNVAYSSNGVVNFLIPSSNSFNPIVNEVSNLEGPVTFIAPDGDTDPTNNPTFRLVRLTATFNPQ